MMKALVWAKSIAKETRDKIRNSRIERKRKKYGAGTMESYFSAKGRGVDDQAMRLYGSLVRWDEWKKEKDCVHNMLWSAVFENDELMRLYPEEISFMRKKKELLLFPYPFIEDYNPDRIEVISDSNLKYVDHNGKKLYFPNFKDEQVRVDYNQLIKEGDVRSPHHYFSDEVRFEKDMIFVDVGAAEGIISLDVIDDASEVYLLECSKMWQKALNKTFKDYLDKIHIVNKYAGSVDSGDVITIDSMLGKIRGKNIFIKMDIEGMELDALKGCVNTIKNNNVCISSACYHTNDQYKELISFFKQNGLYTETSNGFMLFDYGYLVLKNGRYDRIKWPYFRHGIIRAKTKEQ